MAKVTVIPDPDQGGVKVVVTELEDSMQLQVSCTHEGIMIDLVNQYGYIVASEPGACWEELAFQLMQEG